MNFLKCQFEVKNVPFEAIIALGRATIPGSIAVFLQAITFQHTFFIYQSILLFLAETRPSVATSM